MHADLDEDACERLGSCAFEMLTDSMLRYPGLRYLMKAREHSHRPIGTQWSGI